MADIINFKPETRIWICECGCATFHLRSDGKAECAACGKVATAEGQGWFDTLSEKQRDPDLDNPLYDIAGNSSVDFARRRMVKLASGDDNAIIIIVENDGTIRTWSVVETEEQEEWAKRQIESALDLIIDFSQKIRLKGQDT